MRQLLIFVVIFVLTSSCGKPELVLLTDEDHKSEFKYFDAYGDGVIDSFAQYVYIYNVLDKVLIYDLFTNHYIGFFYIENDIWIAVNKKGDRLITGNHYSLPLLKNDNRPVFEKNLKLI